MENPFERLRKALGGRGSRPAQPPTPPPLPPPPPSDAGPTPQTWTVSADEPTQAWTPPAGDEPTEQIRPTAEPPAEQTSEWFRPVGGPGDLPPSDPTLMFPPPAAGGPPARPPVAGSGAGAAAAAAGITVLTAKKRRRRHRMIKAFVALLGIIAAFFVIVFIAYTRVTIPAVNSSALEQTSEVYYGDGKTVYGQFGQTDREIVPLASMPQSLRDAVIAAENRNFYHDSGVSFTGIIRAFWVNIRGGTVQQGGSTITQQYVKNYYLTSKRTLTRKIEEALLAIKLDKQLSKDQILENYLNTIYFGRGAYGVQAAAKAYFNTDVGQLTVPQDAVLAALIRSPGLYDPTTASGLTALQARWNYVLDGMVADKALSAADRTGEQFPAIPTRQKNSQFGGQKGYILTTVEDELEARGLTKDKIENSGLKIYTTLDKQVQAAAETAVPQEFPKSKAEGVRVGLSAVQPNTGKILGMYGGKDFLGTDKYAQISSATYPIEPGSGVKPFSLAAAFENGYGLNSVFNGDSPLYVNGQKIGRNEFNKSYGNQTLMYGLQESINTVFLNLALQLGPPKIHDALVRAGIPADAPGLANVPDITLGTFSVTPTVMADAYATLCGTGVHADPHIVDHVQDTNGGAISITAPKITPSPVFSSAVRSDVLRAMINVVENGTGTAAKALGRPVAGKTGTHNSLTAWFNGCTPQIAASVDYFKGDGTESLDGVAGLPTFFGAVYPTQTWTTFMDQALKGKPTQNFNIGPGVKGTLDLAPTSSPTGPATKSPGGSTTPPTLGPPTSSSKPGNPGGGQVSAPPTTGTGGGEKGGGPSSGPSSGTSGGSGSDAGTGKGGTGQTPPP